ncbi:BTB/POZ domain protein [Opisthorchis viverrini]|uniref:BTB/POZ domain protein n=1 Tax=Opisthorchis viverrini TaxID=6198 RepID=A0A1S8X1F5_OPIVI|nr:BTB/POZ domain protein [Opisthorchis viverrini]
MTDFRSSRNLPTANTESMISLGEASPTRNSELLDNPGPSADSYPQLDHHLYDTAHSALIERDNYLNRFSHTNPTRFSLDFGIVQRGLSDSHIPQAAPRFTNPRTNLNLNSDQPLMVNNPNSRSSLPSQSGTHNNPPAPLSASRDNNQRVLGTNRSSVRPTGMTIPTRASTSSQTRMPLNLRLRRVLAENRGYNATNNVNSIDPPGFGARPPVTLNLAPDSHRSSTTYRSAPPIHSRPLNNEATTNQASNASVNNQSGRSMDRRIRVVRQPNVVVQRVFNMPSEVQSSTSGASSVEDIQVPTVVTPDIRSILNNSESQEQQNPSESSDRSRTPEYSDSSLVEAVDVPHDGDWRNNRLCRDLFLLWVIELTLKSGQPLMSPLEAHHFYVIEIYNGTLKNGFQEISYNSLEDGQENHEELDLNSDLDDITNEAQQSRSVTGRALIASHDQPLSTSCPENKSLRGLSETDSEFIHQVRVQSCNSVGESSNHEESALDNTTTTKSGSVESPSDRSHRVSAMQHTPCKRFAAHRLILATASPVFEAMFYGPVAEMHSRTSEQHTEYRVPDIHPKLNDDPDIVFYVLYAAKKYMLAPLGQRCVEHLKGLITASNVCLMLDRSLFFDEEDLTRRCWHVIDVLRDTLNCKESEVFAAVRRWAGAECVRLGLRDVLVNRAQVAARFLPLVRFPTMTLNDFATNVAYSGFLSLEMVRDLFVHITTNDCSGPPRDGQTEASQTATDKRGDEDIDRANEECGQSMDTQLVIPCSTTQSETAHQLVSSAKNGSPLFSSEPRCGPKVWRCSRFSRTGKHAITPNANGSHQHSISFQLDTSPL